MIPNEDGRLFPGIEESAYHSDRGSLSSSGARTILKSPAKFAYQRDHPVHKDVFDMGTVTHTLVLGEGSEIVVVDADSWRTKAAQTARQEARDAGKTPILAADYQTAQAMADAITQHELAAELLSKGEPELSGYWRDELTGIRLRFRTDWLTEYQGRPLCVDYKTCQSAEPEEFRRSAAKWGYEVQFWWYINGLMACGVEQPGMVFICQEKEAPYLVSVCELDIDAYHEGGRKARRAIDLFAGCTESGMWPGYPPGITTISLPPWAYTAQPTINDLLEAS